MNELAPRPSNPNLMENIDWVATVFVGAFVFFATPYVFDWSKTIFDIAFATDGGQQFNLLQAISEGSLSRRLALFAFAGLGIDSLVRRRNAFHVSPVLGHLLVFYVAWSTASLLWAQDVSLTLRRVIIFWCLGLGALGLAARLSFIRIVTMTLVISSFTLAYSLVSELHSGTFHPLASDFRFSGVMHPVMQGWNCSLMFLSALALVRTGYRPRALLWLLTFAGLAGILLTRSRWPLASSLIGALAIIQMTGSLRTTATIFLWGGVAACVAFLAFIDDPVARLEQLASLGRGREAVESMGSFTGRAQLWSILIDLWSDQPVTGYGYNSFQTPAIISRLQVLMDWEPSNSHSGYIQVLLCLGIVGLLIFMGILVTAMRRAFWLARRAPIYVFAVALLLWLVTNLVLETVVITDPLLPTTVFFVTLAHLALFASSDGADAKGSP